MVIASPYELPADQQRQLDELLASDPGLAMGLRPLLDGEDGPDARALVLHHLSRRLDAGTPIRAALVLALADAMRFARDDYDDA
jgi:hypothetical protein